MGREVEKEPIAVQRCPPSICRVRTVRTEGSLYLRIQDTGRRLAIARPQPFLWNCAFMAQSGAS